MQAILKSLKAPLLVGVVAVLVVGGFAINTPRAFAAKSITVNFAGAGVGSVALSDISDPTKNKTLTATSTSASLGNNDTGTLVATPGINSVFSGWSLSTAGVTGCAGNSCNFSMGNAAQSVTATFSVALLNQTISVSPSAPGSAVYGSSFNVAATSDSALPVSITTTGGCTGSGTSSTTVTMTSGVTACVVHYNQAGNGSYNPAPEVTQSVTAQTKALTISGLTASDKVYDGNNSASLTGTTSLVGVVGLDDVYLSGVPTSTFANKLVGAAKAVSVGGYTLAGVTAANYSLTQPTGLTANITAKDLTVTATGINKVYNALTDASVTFVTDAVGGDNVTVNSAVAAFDDKNVGVSKNISVSGYSLGGADSANYTLLNATTTASADITPKALVVSATGINKVYDATVAASSTYSTDAIGGDVVVSDGVSTFVDKNVGNGKVVNVVGISNSGADAGNYSLSNSTTTTSANITARDLTVTAIGIGKTYDGTFTAFVTLGTDAVSGDDVTATGTATFADELVGDNKPVSVTGISVFGSDAGNYNQLNTTASTTANITPAAATITLDNTNLTRVYDGNAQVVNVVDTNPVGLPYSVTYNGSTTAPTVAGTYTVIAAITDPNYAGTDTVTLTIQKANQTITFGALSNKFYGDADFTVSATSGSGLDVSFTASGSCSVSLDTVHITWVGACDITADQIGDVNWNPATSTTQSFLITDNTPPVISLVGSSTVNLIVGDVYVDAGATALDDIDGDISANIVSSTTPGPVSTAATGIYTISYDVTDAASNVATTITRTVIVRAKITASAGANGSISPLGDTIVDGGGEQDYTITPNSGFQVGSILVDGVEFSPSILFKFVNVSVNHTIIPSFIPMNSTGGNSTGGGQVLGVSTSTVSDGNSTGATTTPGQVLGESTTTVSNSTTTPPVITIGNGNVVFVFNKNLGYGMKNNDVLQLQIALKALGLFNTDPTGYFGPITKAAVKAYQAAHQVSPVSGFFGPLTRASLNALLAK